MSGLSIEKGRENCILSILRGSLSKNKGKRCSIGSVVMWNGCHFIPKADDRGNLFGQKWFMKG